MQWKRRRNGQCLVSRIERDQRIDMEICRTRNRERQVREHHSTLFRPDPAQRGQHFTPLGSQADHYGRPDRVCAEHLSPAKAEEVVRPTYGYERRVSRESALRATATTLSVYSGSDGAGARRLKCERPAPGRRDAPDGSGERQTRDGTDFRLRRSSTASLARRLRALTRRGGTAVRSRLCPSGPCT